MAEILLYGPIGADMWEPENAITAKKVMAELEQIDGDVTVRISSGGGDVYEGIDIMHALKNHPGRVTVIVESLAASAASFIAVGGGDEVLMRSSSELMIHRAWTFTDGNADDVRKTLDDLERQDVKLATIYSEKAGGELDDWLAAMSAETWYTADEAVAAGLADGVVESTPQPEAARAPAASMRRRFKFANRAAAPPPPVTRSESGETTTTPSDGQIGDKMSILNQLAQELGKKPEDVQAALSGFFNETVQITGEVDLTYPEGVEIAPTETVTLTPLVDGAADSVPAGVEFDVTAVADGFTAEVAENGVFTVTAPSGVEPGTSASFTVAINGVDVPVTLTVRSLSDEPGQVEEAPVQETPVEHAPASVTLDRETYDELRAAAQHGWKAMEQQKDTALVAEVDKWVAEGRISAGLRAKAVAAIRRDAQAARDIYGSNPAGTVPRAELGHGKDTDEAASGEVAAKADQAGILTRKNFH